MGSKASPQALRIKINQSWKSLWFGRAGFGKNLVEDIALRRKLIADFRNASISDVLINRNANQIEVNIHTARPGVLIGRGGTGSEKIKKLVEKSTGMKARVNIVEVKLPDIDAMYIAQSIASQIEKRIPFRRAVKQLLERAKDSGAKGVKIQVSGRLNGAEIARSEKFANGTVPLSTFDSVIDYAYVTALTTYGIIGIKVWVYKGRTADMNKDKKSFRK
ncbi:MAG: 30S ribosomal protein S3 [bacterium ADurb.Bin212]|nr:MAG: 30S ribosomal protein S3 [bacterium ADurb.Bin212]